MSEIAVLGLEVNSSKVRRASSDLNEMVRSGTHAEKSAARMASAFNRAAGQLAAVAAAAFGLQRTIGTLAAFEQSMSAVAAITRANTAQMEALRNVARELGATTEFSASQAADGLRFLGMAGFTATESVAAIPAVLNLATAAAMDLGSAADIASNIMSGFGIAASNAADVADVLAAASSRANTNVQQLGAAMSTVAPIAAALDITLADTAAAIGVLSDAGIQGERAGTAMRGVLASLAGPTAEAAEVLSRLGLTIGDVNPETNDLATIFGRLRSASLSTADAMTIFGREAASGALVLVDAADRVGAFGDELSNVTGEAQRMADTMRDNLGGDIQGLMSAVEAVTLSLGDAGLTGALRAGTQTATELLRALADNMDAALQAATGFSVYFAGQYVVSMVAAGGATATLSGALVFLRTAIAGTGVGLLVLLITDVVYRIYDATVGVRAFGESIDRVGETGRSFFETMQVGAELVVSSFDWASSSIATFFLGAFATVRDSFAALMNTILDGLSSIPGVDVSGWKADPTAGTQAFNSSREATRTAYDAMGSNWSRLTQGDGQDRDLGAGNISGQWEQFNSIAPGASGMLTELTEKTGGLGEALTAANDNLVAANANLAHLDAGLRLVNDIETPFGRMQTELAGLNQMFRVDGVISAQEYAAAVSKSMANATASVAGAVGNQLAMLSGAFEDNRALAYATAVVKGIEAVVSSYAAGAKIGGPVVGAAFAATAAAATAGQIAAIASTNVRGGSAPRAPSGSAPSQAPQQQAAPQQIGISLTLAGNGRYSRDEVRAMLEDMTGQINDGVGYDFVRAIKAG
ncbi:phage tail tape measure protein [Pelagibacterium montanilacus]|uniref:phage tail tape measure protein n=1 Tax=Pelagibacterium montanilacus TaxID=2185280 RepID=UPI000F8D2C6F|nr:phage tail tape measure protein [Pelagibacterium montanilacus]